MKKTYLTAMLLLFALAGMSQAGTTDPTFAGYANQWIQAAALQTDGKIVVGGLFTQYGGVTRNRIARVNSDGTLDTSFVPGTTGLNSNPDVVLLQPDGKVLAGGGFTNFSGTARNHVVRLDANGALDTSFSPGAGPVYNPSGTSESTGYVYSMALQPDGKLLVGGFFTHFDGVSRYGIARLNANGTVDTSFTTPSLGTNYQSVDQILVLSDGKIIITGSFSSYSGVTRQRVARLNADGSIDTTFGTASGADSRVQQATLQADGKILIGGYFTQYGGVSRAHIARLNADGSLDTTFNPGTGVTGSGEYVYAITVEPDGNILVGGSFTAINGVSVSTNICRLSATGGVDTAFNSGGSGANNVVSKILLQPDGKRILTGQFNTYNGASNNASYLKIVRIYSDYCQDTTTWNGSSWSEGAPTSYNYRAVINGNFSSSASLKACSLTVNSGTVTVNPGHNFSTLYDVDVSSGATLTFENNANLVQEDNGVSAGTINSGTITFKKNSSLLYPLDYTLWSTPVSGSQTLKQFSPQTLDTRFYVYNTALSAWSNYASASGIFGGLPENVTFTAAKGYLIRMPTGLNGQTVFNGSFNGTPRNGSIGIALSTANERFNAVGNPYPSPLNVWNFIDSNVNNLDNGTLYFWRKTNDELGATSSYATLTKAAYVANSALGGDTGTGYFNSGDGANWVINPGQGFIVKAKTGAGQLSFTNTMRRAVNNGQFFRTANNTETEAEAGAEKLWLNITGENNEFGQAAVAYIPEATVNIDYGWDGVLVSDGNIAIYSIAEDTQLVIQARPAFDVADEVQIGYKAATAGNFTINLYQTEGILAQPEQDIYLIDSQLGIVHNLKSGDYTFASEAGTFNSRFTLVYVSALNINNPDTNSNSVIVYKKNNSLHINTGKTPMKNVTVYDIRGRVLYSSKDINATATEISNLQVEHQVIIVQVTMSGDVTVSKKIIF